MPELPEVETIRRDLAPRLIGRRIMRVWTDTGPRYGRLEAAIGREILRLERRGKYLLADLGERELVIHLGMSGRLFMAVDEPRMDHLRAVFGLDGPEDLVFVDMRRFGTLQVVEPGDYGGLPTLSAMGPEPLSDAFAKGAFALAVAGSGTPIKALLLAQKAVAGLGNIYVDEALHRAGIHPGQRGVDKRKAALLHKAIRDVVAEAITGRGTTFSLYRDGHLAEGSFYESLLVFDRKGKPCHSCGSLIEKTRLAGRGTHFCPTCQPARTLGNGIARRQESAVDLS